MPARKGPSTEEIKRLYWDEQKTPAEIAGMFGISPHTIRSRMRREGIERRTRLEGSRLSSRWPGRTWRESERPLKDVLRCPDCKWRWKRGEDERTRQPCPNCGRRVEARKRLTRDNGEKLRLWRNNHRDEALSRARDNRRRERLAVLGVVGHGRVACVRCGCDRPELLEINHINGGGRKEYLESGTQFYRNILNLVRDTDDLELTCRVCNALHALELKHGPLPYQVIYGGSDDGQDISGGREGETL